jgi:hypothetical protein
MKDVSYLVHMPITMGDMSVQYCEWSVASLFLILLPASLGDNGYSLKFARA